MQNLDDIKRDKTALSRADGVFFRVESPLNEIVGVLILAMMILTVVNILSRKFFNLPLFGFIDWLVLTVPFIAFLGLACCQREGGHIRMEILIGRLRGRALWGAELLTSLAGIAVLAVLIYGSLDHALRALRIGDSTPIAYIDTWPSKLVVTFGLALLLFRLVLQSMSFARALILNDHDPAGVPRIADAAKQAAREEKTHRRADGGDSR